MNDAARPPIAGRYRLEAPIAEGAFGTVWRAVQIDTGRSVALKLLRPELLAENDGRARFRREAELAQKLTHPNTVRLLDFGEADTGPFIVWELLRGRTLAGLIAAEGKLEPARVARIAAQVLKSLLEAHALGIVHRDIKPANLFLCPYAGEPDFLKVLDFGIAKTAQVPGQTAAGLTREGFVLGTPSYMAPEQARGETIGAPADLYALGLVIAEALTGEVVFKGAAMQVCLAQMSDAPVPLAPEVLHSPLGPVVHRATQKAASRRYASALDMLQHLEMELPTGAGASASPAGPAGAPTAQIAAAPTFQGGMPAEPPTHHGGPYAWTPGAPGPAPHPMIADPGHGVSPAASLAQSRGRGPALGCMVAAGVVLLACGGGLVVFLAGWQPFSFTDGSGASAGTAPAAAAAPLRLRELTPDLLRGRIEAAGWKVDDTKVTDGGWLVDLTFEISRPPDRAVVKLMRYHDPAAAERFERVLKDNLHTALRDENTILSASVATGERRASQALLDTLSR